VTSSDLDVIRTARLLVRKPQETDRARFVDFFCNDDFMVYYPRTFTEQEAHHHFDHMVGVCQAVPFGKQPVVELSSGAVVGYTGVDYIDFEGQTRLEWGYRLVPQCRGFGYATEASQALLAKARETYVGELLCLIDPDNIPSQNVCRKLGFRLWKQAPLEGDLCNVYTLDVGQAAR
jgi:RimJ/RimL family protein N-acetyltransferase